RSIGAGPYKFNTASAFEDDMFTPNNRQMSEQTSRELELEMKRIVDECLETARELLGSHKKELDAIAALLVEKETIYFKDLAKIMEPQRTDADLEKEIAQLAERKFVGRPIVIDINAIGIRGGSPGPSSSTQPGV